MKDPYSVQLFGRGDKYYVTAESVEKYMYAARINNPDTAFINIAEANKIAPENIAVVGEGDYLISEKAIEDDAMTLDQAEKFYKNLTKKCKDEAKTKEELDNCISMLEQCVKKMNAEIKKIDNGEGSNERIKYSLKAMIPFNGIYRCLKRNDWVAGQSYAAGLVVKLVLSLINPALGSFGVVTDGRIRCDLYCDMLKDCINECNLAIEYLKDKKSKLK